MRHVGWIAVCVLLGCGSGSSNKPSTGGSDNGGSGGSGETGGSGEGTPDKETLCKNALEAARAAHDEAWQAIEAAGPPQTLDDMAQAACHLYCGRATECAIEEACAEMSAPEIADLQLDKTAPENTRQCIEKCASWRMSKAQIQVLGTCSQQDSACADWRSCTEKAQSQ